MPSVEAPAVALPALRTVKLNVSFAPANADLTLKLTPAITEGVWTGTLWLGTLGGGKYLDLELAAAGNTEVVKAKPSAIPEKMKSKIVSVVAEGDLVTVAYVREVKDPKDPARTYTTTWFDMWRIKDGKADEHWDPATR